MGCECVLKFLERNNMPVLTKKKHDHLMYDDECTYILKEGVVKVSMILEDGREFNVTYLKAPDVISLFLNELNQVTIHPLRVRIESEEAGFYCISKEMFEDLVEDDENVKNCIDTYYREKLKKAIYRQQFMTMNSKTGAVCTFIYRLISLFGKTTSKGILIDLFVTNDDIAGFCGISTRNSVNRILRGLRDEKVIQIVNNKILIKNVDYLKQYA